MANQFDRSLVDPARGTEGHFLQHRPDLASFVSNVSSPHSSGGSTISSIFDKASAHSSRTTVASDRSIIRLSTPEESRFSTYSIGDSNLNIVDGEKEWKIVEDLVIKNIRKAESASRNGDGVGFTLDLQRDRPLRGTMQVTTYVGLPQGTATASLSTKNSPNVSDFLAVSSPSGGKGHKPKGQNISVTTVKSFDSDQERNRPPCGQDIWVFPPSSNIQDPVPLFGYFDTGSYHSWISTKALLALGISPEVGDDQQIKPISGESNITTHNIMGYQPHGKIYLNFRPSRGPGSTEVLKKSFLVAMSDAPWQVLLGQDYPYIYQEIYHLNMITIGHPKTREQIEADKARAQEHAERKRRIEARKKELNQNSNTKSIPDVAEKNSGPSRIQSNAEGSVAADRVGSSIQST